MRWIPKRWGDVDALAEEWFNLPTETKIVLMQAAPQFYSRMSWFAARVFVAKQMKEGRLKPR